MPNRSLSDQNSKTLILITNHFPYGLAESFLEHEIDYLKKGFDQVIILCRDVTSEAVRNVNFDCIIYRVDPQSSFSEKLLTLGLCIKHSKKLWTYLKEEFDALRSNKKSVTWKIFQVMIHDLTKAITTSHHLEKIIQKHVVQGKVWLYSYWLTSSALATTFVKAKPTIVLRKFSRVHGGDVYEYRNSLHYLSFRYTLFKHLDHIYSISKSGQDHLEKTIRSSVRNKISVSRLGVPGIGFAPEKNERTFLLVSCSFLLPVKQVKLIIESIALVENFNLNWIHIGDGPLRTELEAMASLKLGAKKNIQYQFMGSVSNVALLQFYAAKFVDLFVNTSASEGIPVTMMEAQAHGIPILALDVGGVKEIVSANSGKLLPANASAEIIAEAIEEIQTLDGNAYHMMRKNAFQSWQSHYNADQNFSTFVAEILNL